MKDLLPLIPIWHMVTERTSHLRQRPQQRQSLANTNFNLVLVPLFLIISSSVYPAIISGIYNNELSIMADALAQLEQNNNNNNKNK